MPDLINPSSVEPAECHMIVGRSKSFNYSWRPPWRQACNTCQWWDRRFHSMIWLRISGVISRYHVYVCIILGVWVPSWLCVYHNGCMYTIMVVCVPSWLYVYHHGCMCIIMGVCVSSWLCVCHFGCMCTIMIVCFPSWLYVYHHGCVCTIMVWCTIMVVCVPSWLYVYHNGCVYHHGCVCTIMVVCVPSWLCIQSWIHIYHYGSMCTNTHMVAGVPLQTHCAITDRCVPLHVHAYHCWYHFINHYKSCQDLPCHYK